MTELNRILGNSVEKYQYLINNTADAIVEIDLSGIFTYISPQVQKIFGYLPKEIIGAKFFNYIHPDDMPSIMDTLEKAIKSEDPVSLEYRVRHKEGHYVNVSANASLVKVDGNLKIVGVLKDITEKKLAEQKLKESEETFKKIINQSFMGIVIVQDLFIKYVNEAVIKMLGYSKEEMVNWSVNDLLKAIHPNDRTIARERLEQRQEGKRNESRYTYKIFTKTGDLSWIDIYAKQIYYQGKKSILATLMDVTEREKGVLKVKESEEKYRELFNNMSNGVAVYEAVNDGEDFIFRDFNLAGEKIDNVRREDLIDKKVSEVFPGVKEFGLFDIFQKVWRTGNSESHPIKLYKDNRIEGWRENYIYKLPSGKIVAVYDDITERKKADKKLEESEEQYRVLSDQSLMGIGIIENGVVKYVNEALQEINEFTEEEMLNWAPKEFLNFIHPDDRHLVVNNFEELLNKKVFSSQFSCRAFSKSGKEKNLKTYSKLIDYDGKPSIYLTLIDNTDRRKAEQNLIESEEKYRMIFAGASDPIAIMEGENIIDCNDITVELFGYNNKDEIIGNPLWKISPAKQPDGKDSVKKANNVIKKALLGEPQRFYWKHMKKDGTLFDAEISLSNFKLENKEYIMAIIRDITERKKAERELREISQLKSELLERTSHELKTPLISIKGFTNLLLDLHKDKFDPETISILDEVRQGTEQLEIIINKLLETSYLASGKLDFKPILDDLSFLIKFCVKNLRGLANTRNHFISLDIQEKIIVNFEKEKLYEVVSHLLINAIKYTPPNGEIKIRSESKGDFIIISVEDNGVGISKEDQKKIFKQFGKIERYGQGWDIGIAGTGLGLYTSKKIVELHGGKIWVESKGRNMGSKFCFSLPFSNE